MLRPVSKNLEQAYSYFAFDVCDKNSHRNEMEIPFSSLIVVETVLLTWSVQETGKAIIMMAKLAPHPYYNERPLQEDNQTKMSRIKKKIMNKALKTYFILFKTLPGCQS